MAQIKYVTCCMALVLRYYSNALIRHPVKSRWVVFLDQFWKILLWTFYILKFWS